MLPYSTQAQAATNPRQILTIGNVTAAATKPMETSGFALSAGTTSVSWNQLPQEGQGVVKLLYWVMKFRNDETQKIERHDGGLLKGSCLLGMLASGFQMDIRVILSLLLERRSSRQSREQVYTI